MLVSPSKDLKFLEELVNHPDVYQWVHGDIEGPIDVSSIAVREFIILKADSGAFLFVNNGSNSWEVHTQFLRKQRAYPAAKDAAEYMFTNTPCEQITTMVPRNNVAAKRLTQKIGFSYVGTKGTWPTDSGPVPLDHFTLTKQRWQECQ